jgi:hypothetical protein
VTEHDVTSKRNGDGDSLEVYVVFEIRLKRSCDADVRDGVDVGVNGVRSVVRGIGLIGCFRHGAAVFLSVMSRDY